MWQLSWTSVTVEESSVVRDLYWFWPRAQIAAWLEQELPSCWLYVIPQHSTMGWYGFSIFNWHGPFLQRVPGCLLALMSVEMPPSSNSKGFLGVCLQGHTVLPKRVPLSVCLQDHTVFFFFQIVRYSTEAWVWTPTLLPHECRGINSLHQSGTCTGFCPWPKYQHVWNRRGLQLGHTWLQNVCNTTAQDHGLS